MLTSHGQKSKERHCAGIEKFSAEQNKVSVQIGARCDLLAVFFRRTVKPALLVTEHGQFTTDQKISHSRSCLIPLLN